MALFRMKVPGVLDQDDVIATTQSSDSREKIVTRSQIVSVVTNGLTTAILDSVEICTILGGKKWPGLLY